MNKLFGLFLLALAFLAPSAANAATCNWVGGTGSINDVTHWSSSSGGAGSTCAAAGGWPNGGNGDSAVFDGSSGSGTITRNVSWSVGSINVGSFTGTFGNAGDSATVNLTSWSNGGSATRTVNMGTSTWTCGITAVVSCSWSQAGATNLTFNANTSTVVLSGATSGNTQTCSFGSQTYNVITFNPDQSGSKGSTCNPQNTTIGTLNIGAPNYISITTGVNLSITTLNFTGGTPSITALTTLISATFANTFTFTLTNPASCTYCVFRDMTAVTSAITATNAINLGNNTNISITPPTIGGGGGGRIIGG